MEKYDTIKYYDDNAEQYCEQTRNGDMSSVYNRFLVMLPDKAYILDFGCGSGRDSKVFIDKGYSVTSVDGSEKMCELASKNIGQKVECMQFDQLRDTARYDGIWACSSILHVEREKLPDILRKMIEALKENGVIYTCFKKGDKCEVRNGRYFNDMTRELLEEMLKDLEVNAEITDYFENESTINDDKWGNYYIKKSKEKKEG